MFKDIRIAHKSNSTESTDLLITNKKERSQFDHGVQPQKFHVKTFFFGIKPSSCSISEPSGTVTFFKLENKPSSHL